MQFIICINQYTFSGYPDRHQFVYRARKARYGARLRYVAYLFQLLHLSPCRLVLRIKFLLVGRQQNFAPKLNAVSCTGPVRLRPTRFTAITGNPFATACPRCTVCHAVNCLFFFPRTYQRFPPYCCRIN